MSTCWQLRDVTYDAYGNNLGFDPATALTTLLYSGEQFDQRIAMQYLRARYYDPAAGRFNRLDPFSGTLKDPQSLHKYLYVHWDPVGFIDPTGWSLLPQLSMATWIRISVFGTLGVAVGAALLFRFGGCPSLHGTPAAEGIYDELTVPVVIVRVKRPTNVVASPAPSLDLLRRRLEATNDFWQRYGIRLRVDDAIEIDKPEWHDIKIEFGGRGELQEAIDELARKHKGKIVVLAISNFEGEGETATGAATAYSRNGFATWTTATTTLAHESGHVLWARMHVDSVQKNLMNGALSDTGAGLDEVFLSQRQVRTIRDYIKQKYPSR